MRIKAALLLLLVACNTYAWNAMGHELVAQIAYDNLTPTAKRLSNQYNKAVNRSFAVGGFIKSSAWLDLIRINGVHWFDTLHYIDIPFSNDGTALPPIPEINALSAIKNAVVVLNSNKASDADKGLSLRILVHTVGDIHQPLHTAAFVSQEHPQGDLGGNLFALGENPIATNLHAYWDKGGGILVGQSTDYQIRNKAHQLESQWSCKTANAQKNPEQWAQASHQLAVSQVYTLSPGTIPSKRYQLTTQNITQKQILFAGCRLATMLNRALG